MNKASQIILLVADAKVYNAYPIKNGENEDERMGAYLIANALSKHFRRHIDSFCGKTMFVSQNSPQKILEIVNKKVSYYCRQTLQNDRERVGAEKMLAQTKKEVIKIIG